MPKISVLMSVYNTKEEYLREAIESILNQTFTDFEFIILNDSPQAEYLSEIVNSYNDERIKYYINNENLGISKSRNKLLKLAQGEYIAIFDHDDISLPERLMKESEYLDKNPDIGVVSCNFEFMSTGKKTNYPKSNIKIKETLLDHNCILHSGMMIRKFVLDKYGINYEEEYTPAEDYMLCIRLMEHTMFHNLGDVLMRYRDYEGNTTSNNLDKMLDADRRCKSVVLNYKGYKTYKNKRYWIKLFKFIPLLKVKENENSINVYLFGLIPVVSLINGKKI